jgi:hypothetical protein
MGFTKRWDTNDILKQINSAGSECSDMRNNGFTAWSIKQDLYKIKWRLEEILGECPTFATEDEFLSEREKKLMWYKLKNDL